MKFVTVDLWLRVHQSYSSVVNENMDKKSLKDLLSSNINKEEQSSSSDEDEDLLFDELNAQTGESSVDFDKFCIECTDMPIELLCEPCDEKFCKVCWEVVHRSGKRKDHKTVDLKSEGDPSQLNGKVRESVSKQSVSNGESHQESTELTLDDSDIDSSTSSSGSETLASLRSSITYIPLRLTHEERRLLRLLEAALNVSEYTDKIDIISYKSKSKRIIAEIKEICSILAGLVVAQDFKIGQKFVEDKNFSDNAEWYKNIFEIGRRYKVMNPEKMRDSFGKLCFMIMDSRYPEVKDQLEFDLYKPMKTIELFLLERDPQLLEKLFSNDLVLTATAEIVASEGKSRFQLNKEKKMKDMAIERLANKYHSVKLTKEEIRQLLYSIGDFHSYINFNRSPINRILHYLESNFLPQQELSQYSLGIHIGKGGARLSHNHETQYYFCHQSLTMWSIIQRDFIKLWKIADEDLLSKVNYKLADTGQGLQRIKAAPQTQRWMYKIILEVQRKTPVSFIGSLAVHIADTAVPLALNFLDKYIQVPRILIPVDRCLSMIDEIAKDPFMRSSIENEFGGCSELKLVILADFFRHAFNGSGGQDYFNAGSCIDGRLTSAWNWANLISKKSYYKYFLLSGFVGFNGSDGW